MTTQISRDNLGDGPLRAVTAFGDRAHPAALDVGPPLIEKIPTRGLAMEGLVG